MPQCATQEEVEKLVKEQEDAQKEAACLMDAAFLICTMLCGSEGWSCLGSKKNLLSLEAFETYSVQSCTWPKTVVLRGF